MNNAYEYDVEIYPNLFEVTFIPKTADQKLIDVYKAVDIRCLAIKNGKEGNLEELKEAKAKLLLAMGAKQFVIGLIILLVSGEMMGHLLWISLFNIKFLLVITVIIMIKLCWIFLLITINILM